MSNFNWNGSIKVLRLICHVILSKNFVSNFVHVAVLAATQAYVLEQHKILMVNFTDNKLYSDYDFSRLLLNSWFVLGLIVLILFQKTDNYILISLLIWTLHGHDDVFDPWQLPVYQGTILI